MLKWIAFVTGTVVGILMMIGFIYMLSANWVFAIALIAAVGWFVQEYYLPIIEGSSEDEVV